MSRPSSRSSRVGRDAQEPLFEVALLDNRVFVAPAAAVDDLFVGEHGAALGAPVDLALLAIDKAALVHAEEEPLVPAVVVGEAGGDFAGPVEAHAQAAELALHAGDVGEGPLAGRRVVLERGVFGGQAEGIPAHGVKHVVAAHPHVAREGVADSVVADVAHVKLAARIGQHLEHVVLGLAAVDGVSRVQRGIRGPALLPFRLDHRGVVALFFFFRHKLLVYQ